MSTSRPAKRRRTKNAPKAGCVTRSDGIWHTDGSVVLQAEQTQWKVHWTILALHSSYFRDLHAQPHPPKPSDIDGCPIIELSDDAQDVEDILKALYIPTFHCKEKLPLPVVRAFIRLGRKYDFKDLVESAISRIMSEAPTTLEEYDAMKDTIGFRSFEDFNGMEFDLIILASENNLLAALPSLYYRAVKRWSPGMLFDEIEAEDGTVVSLPRVDLRRCLEGRHNIFKAQFEPRYTYAWMRKWELEGCTDWQQCGTSREAFINDCCRWVDIRAFRRASDHWLPNDRYQFCASCVEHITESMDTGRKKMWEDLPCMFDLPPWNELKKGA
ncbi:hypothetical protein B0H12DRAFT_1190796 [Mycena haematopus]|nr:hypothetical protein B0H12DRAFT_1190796 [Mycena haematopus]